MTYLDKAALLAALTTLQEQDYPKRGKAELEQAIATTNAELADTKDGDRRFALVNNIANANAELQIYNLLGGTVRIRELTAGERQQAEQAATTDPDAPDNALYRAMVVSFGLVEPKLSLEDVATLTGGRAKAIERLAIAILGLSEAAPGDIKEP